MELPFSKPISRAVKNEEHRRLHLHSARAEPDKQFF